MTKKIRQVAFIFMVLLVTAWPVSSSAEQRHSFEQFDIMIGETLQSLATDKIPAFVSECSLREGKATLFFALGQPRGVLIEWDQNRRVINYPGLELEDGKFLTDLGIGGEHTTARLLSLIEELKARPFQFLPPEALPGLRKSNPQYVCTKTQP